MRLIFIRHGMTAGNLEKRYIGSTDEPLSPAGAAALRARTYPVADVLYCSPMRRCVETAEILYPGKKPVLIPDFRECDFGRYEGKSYPELIHDAPYLAWVESGGVLPFPDGEDTAAFKARCAAAFCRVTEKHAADDTLAFVVHGGTIMSILETYEPSHTYFGWQCKNGEGYRAVFADGIITVEGAL